MRIAFGALYIRAPDFWELTYFEYKCAVDGWQTYGPPGWFKDPDKDPETKQRSSKYIDRTLAELHAMMEEHPDGPETDPRIIGFWENQARL